MKIQIPRRIGIVSGPNCALCNIRDLMYPCQHSGPYFLIHGIGLFWCKEEGIRPILTATPCPSGLWVQRSIFWSTCHF